MAMLENRGIITAMTLQNWGKSAMFEIRDVHRCDLRCSLVVH